MKVLAALAAGHGARVRCGRHGCGRALAAAAHALSWGCTATTPGSATATQVGLAVWVAQPARSVSARLDGQQSAAVYARARANGAYRTGMFWQVFFHDAHAQAWADASRSIRVRVTVVARRRLQAHGPPARLRLRGLRLRRPAAVTFPSAGSPPVHLAELGERGLDLWLSWRSRHGNDVASSETASAGVSRRRRVCGCAEDVGLDSTVPGSEPPRFGRLSAITATAGTNRLQGKPRTNVGMATA